MVLGPPPADGPSDPQVTRDEEDTPRVRFRRFLRERVTTGDALRWYVAEAVTALNEDPGVREALAELVDQAGRLLGFEVTVTEEPPCSRWISPGGRQLLVRAVQPAEAAREVSTIARLRGASLASSPAPSVTGLVVVCGDPAAVSARDVLLRRAADVVRIVSIEALVRLARAHDARALAHAEALTLLEPARVLADEDIAVATRAGGE